MPARHTEASNKVFHKSSFPFEPFSTRDGNQQETHNMNTSFKTELVALRQNIPFVPVGILIFGFLGIIATCSAERPGSTPAVQTQSNEAAAELSQAEPETTIPPEELEALVAPIALYPDPLLIQVLAASTYPLEIVQLKQWLDENKKLKDKALVEAVAQQKWDPSVQALAAFPAVVNKLANKIQWTTDVGNAFLAQESDVMDAVQRLREKAQANGTLKTNDKQTVGTEATNDGKEAITIEPAQDNVVYVPTYNTQYVYRDSDSSGYSGYRDYSGSDYSGYSGSGSGYDYSYLGYAVGAASGYYWGRYNWRDGYPEVNYNNYYNSRYNQNWNNKNKNSNNNASSANNNASSSSNKASNWSKKFNNVNGSDKSAQSLTQGAGKWQHNPSHRGNAPYGNSNLANRFGQANNRPSGGAGNRASQPATARTGNQLAQASRQSQGARANAGNQPARNNLSRGPQGARPSTRLPNAGAPNRIGSRMPSNWPNAARGGAFGPSNGDLARAFSGRGAQSMAPSRMGPPQGLRASGPPMGGGFRGGPPGGGFRGGPPMGGFGGGPPMGGGLPGGLPGGGAPPPPPPPAP
jgi:Protein of unknown function (DUF3300)